MMKIAFLLTVFALTRSIESFYIPPKFSDPCIYLNKCDEVVKYILDEEEINANPTKAAIRKQIFQEMSKLMSMPQNVALEKKASPLIKKMKEVPQLFGDDNSAFEEIYLTRMG